MRGGWGLVVGVGAVLVGVGLVAGVRPVAMAAPLANGGFEDGDVNGWSRSPSGATLQVVASPVAGGAWAGRLTTDGTSSEQRVFQTVAVTAGNEYRFDVMVRSEVAGVIFDQLEAQLVFYELAGGFGAVLSVVVAPVPGGPNTTTYSLTSVGSMAPASAASLRAVVRAVPSGPVTGRLYVDVGVITETVLVTPTPPVTPPSGSATATPPVTPPSGSATATVATTGTPTSTTPAGTATVGPTPAVTATRTATPLPTAPACVDQLRITEVHPAPVVGGEWVELLNGCPTTVNLLGLYLRDNVTRDALPDHALAPGRRVVVLGAGAIIPAGATVVFLASPTIGNGLSPQADLVSLETAGGAVIDRVNWGIPSATWAGYTPQLWNPGLAAPGTGRSLARRPRSTGLARADWSSGMEASPGRSEESWAAAPVLNRLAAGGW